jgi:hypothetical protein
MPFLLGQGSHQVNEGERSLKVRKQKGLRKFVVAHDSPIGHLIGVGT